MFKIGDEVMVQNLKGTEGGEKQIERFSVFLGKKGKVTEVEEGHPYPITVDFGIVFPDFDLTYCNFKKENLKKL